ncbi:MAG: Na+/H+ antiporter NhaC family protein [Candidatus Endonucleobacter bathymodioli]|uniref:Na+/H+ antiporter NhaC family protein n=1 Tax=Candidatus Endonucleibacter bathymodioli TaxID=539814 RepID=A0AA90NK29_9GAMM|nr:Na+/H+ antiporter NhaC family protein [Candidatus Endonucleobacter bathymodioli]
MGFLDYSHSALSLVVPTISILLVIVTRKVLLSLGVSILVGSLLLTGYSPLESITYTARSFGEIFWKDGLNENNFFIVLFLLLLGVITSLINLSGGTRAFGKWARSRVKSRQGAQLSIVLLGFLIFIDDYFNSLAVGSISRPLADGYRISRAKLAYLIDSTAAPVCVIVPMSSWGAYIIGLIGSIMIAHGVYDMSAMEAFLTMVPMNFYAVFALAMVLATACLDLNVGAMRSHEDRAHFGELYDPAKGIPPGSVQLIDNGKGRVSDLVVPLVILVLATLGSLIWTGAVELGIKGQPFSLLDSFAQTDVPRSLVYGAITGLVLASLRMVAHKIAKDLWYKAVLEGINSMLPAIYILIFAWVLAGVINNLETGKYLASLMSGTISTGYLPMILFVVSGVMSFATGTSWGAFGIMLPIAGDMAEVADIAMLMPMLSAVLAGAVFGDHCSPISDTTILSSTGASCHHIDHVITQLPYAFAVAGISIFGYFIMGLTDSTTDGFIAALIAFFVVVVVFRKLSKGSFLGGSTSV